MDVNWYGQAMFKIKGKSATLVVDPYNPEFTGLKLPKDLSAQVVLVTHQHQDHSNASAVEGNPLVISGPGEYEISGVSVAGLHTYHDKVQGVEKGSNTIYHIILDGISLVHLGDLGHVLTDEQTSAIDQVDILMIPVGGGPTIDAEAAAKVVSLLEPKIVIPMHYDIDGLKLTPGKLAPFLKEMGAENVTPISKLSITKDKLPEETTVIVLNRS